MEFLSALVRRLKNTVARVARDLSLLVFYYWLLRDIASTVEVTDE